MSMMVNPKQLKTRTAKQPHPLFAGGKYYFAVLYGTGYARATRRIFKRASEAQSYADRVKVRWERLYDAALMNMVVNS